MMKTFRLAGKRWFVATVLLLSALVLCMVLVSSGAPVAAAQDEIPVRQDEEGLLAFSVDTGSYVSGVAYVGASSADMPAFQLIPGAMSGDIAVNAVEYFYRWQNGVEYDENDGDWTSLGNVDPETNACEFIPESLIGVNTYYNKYVFFKARYLVTEEDGQQYYLEYQNPVFVDLIYLKSTGTDDFAIKDITSTYKVGSADVTYDSQYSSPWVSTSITFRVTLADESLSAANVWYELGDQPARQASLVDDGDGTYSFVATVAESYRGEVYFYGGSPDGTQSSAYSGRRAIQLDVATPQMAISALSNGQEYHPGTWASNNVVYSVRPDPDSTPNISGALFYFKTQDMDEWQEMSSQADGSYAYTFAETTLGVQFKAVSLAGKESEATDPRDVLIDPVTPDLQLSATDGDGMKILSMGSESASGFRVGYATDSIRFVLYNGAADQQSRITYQYKLQGQGDDAYVDINETNGAFVLSHSHSATAPIVDRTYVFRAVSQAGLTDGAEFTVTVVPKTFEFSMEDVDLTPNDQGWLKDDIELIFRVPNFFPANRASEYDFYSQLGEDNTSLTRVDAVFVDTADGYSRFRVVVDTLLDGTKPLRFYAINKAGNKSEWLSLLYEGNPVRLDNRDPVAEVVRQLDPDGHILAEGDWANGAIKVTLKPRAEGSSADSPEANISGVRCFTRINGFNTDEIVMQDGVFVKTFDTSGVYRFVLISGAGRETVISVSIDIETKTSIEVMPGGIVATTSLGTEIPYDGSVTIAQDVTVTFDTNQNGHFLVYFRDVTNVSDISVDLSDYTMSGDETLFVAAPSDGATTRVFDVILVSKAYTYDGQRAMTERHRLTFRYDVVDFVLTVDYTATSDWVSSIDFAFSISDPSVTVTKYQMRLMDYQEGVWGEWIDLNEVDLYNPSYTFQGVMQSYRGIEAGRSFRGKIEFRALNKAGYPSNEVGPETVIMVDSSIPDPFYAVAQTIGDFDIGANSLTVYSKEDIFLRSSAKSGDPLFDRKSPITYYYKVLESADAVLPAFDINTFTALSEDASINLANGSVYAIYAVNGLSANSIRKFIFVKQVETTSGYIQGGILGPTGNLEFNWSDRAEVKITAHSDTAISIWYQIGDGTWERYEENGNPYFAVNDSYNVTKSIWFLGEADGTRPTAIVGNLNDTVRFRITNRAGDVYDDLPRVRIQIDVDSPDFTIDAMIGDQILTDFDRWYNQAIQLRITPDSPDQNPGGVKYSYCLNNENGQYIPLNVGATFISTDYLTGEGYDGNGEFTVYIKAVPNANTTKVVIRSITLRIDKVVPDFNLKGTVTMAGGSTKTLASGEWTNADEVRISLEVLAEGASQIRYFYHFGDINNVTEWPAGGYVSQRIETVYVYAENEAGVRVEREFSVKIDKIPPKINSGSIKNNENDPDNPYRYYIDQVITFEEENLKEARYNNFPLTNGAVIATNTVDNSNGGYVHIVVEDLAGNKTELKFYMTVFDLNVNTITLSDADIALLERFQSDFNNAASTLTASRREYFDTYIGRLWDRVATLQKEIDEYRQFLEQVNIRVSFELKSDFADMEKYYNYFNTDDVTVRYPEWQQKKILEGVYAGYYSKLDSEYKKLLAQMETIRTIEKQATALPAINVVETSDYQEILRVYNAYDSLTNDQKSVFQATLYTKLTEIKRRCEVLLLQDSSTGISINGDDLAAGATIEVVSYDKKSELFNNAQLAILETVSENDPRAIVSISKVGLTGYGSQFDTGTITVSLPIPDDFLNYIYFDVYKLGADGTITPIADTTIAGDGKSISFETNQLDTYILVTKANLTVREKSKEIYGTFAGIEIDATLLTYITYAACGMFGLLVLIMIIMGIRKGQFLRRYNKSYKYGLAKRGIDNIPKGNPAPYANPVHESERMNFEQRVYEKKRRAKKKKIK